MVERILAQTGSNEWSLWLSGANNFRYSIFPQYKANRIGKPRPKWLECCREHLVTEWAGRVTDGYEADDALAMERGRIGGRGIVASIDKDLQQIAGRHYNFVKEEWTEVTDEQATYNFYWHCLVGDAADNIRGAPGIGPKKASRILASGDSDGSLFDLARRTFGNDGLYLLTGQLIWLLRKEGDVWNPPQLQHVISERGMDHRSESMLTMPEETPLSTEHIIPKDSGDLSHGANTSGFVLTGNHLDLTS